MKHVSWWDRLIQEFVIKYIIHWNLDHNTYEKKKFRNSKPVGISRLEWLISVLYVQVVVLCSTECYFILIPLYQSYWLCFKASSLIAMFKNLS